jgi:hypothetical protein
VEGLLRQGQGSRKAARIEMLLREATILGLDERGFTGWRVAADLWANCKHHEPSVVLSEGDLLIVATALTHDRQLVTVDSNLQASLKVIGYESLLHVLPALRLGSMTGWGLDNALISADGDQSGYGQGFRRERLGGLLGFYHRQAP